ncbi:hypothetical protein [Pseudomonas sp. Leaf58]|uniref:hypothetical protein n=1 Tax=Pseudomonas sp. Leaf58 TaxID=1736226 RepID=UPI0006F7123E|nr:hypothetical protein [Pseudomonas sp. Leaf58]KQN62109.1 hypothetical protein ASF02_07980 [Pseudomonas sp. Leaf58]
MSETQKPWKSRLLESLGVTSTAIQTSGPKGKACGLALAAAFTCALGGVSLDTQAAEPIKKESASEAASTVAYSVVGIEEGDGVLDRSTKVAATLGKIVMSPQTEVLSMGAQAAAGSAAGAGTESSLNGKHVAGLVGTAVGVSVAAPVYAGLMVISQVHDSYVYVQESQERAVKVKMEEVEERVASVKDQFTQEIRMEDRKNRQSWPEDRKAFDQKRMYDMAVGSVSQGEELSEEVQIRYDIEQQVVAAGGTPEPWFEQFSEVKEQLAADYQAKTSQMLAAAESLGQEATTGTVIEKIDLNAAFGGGGLKTSNKNFSVYSKDSSKKHDQELGR